MPFQLRYTLEAQQQYNELSKNKNLAKRFKAVRKALRFLSTDAAHPGLNTHKYDSLEGPEQASVFEAYAENNTPSAYRIFWCYYPPKRDTDKLGTITVIAITAHP